MIPTNFELAGDFMEAFGQDVHVQPTWPDFSTRELRLELIREEYEELEEAIENRDLVEVADALTDLLYVIYGAGHAFGIDLDECYLEVHRSNMSKLGEDGRPMKFIWTILGTKPSEWDISCLSQIQSTPMPSESPSQLSAYKSALTEISMWL